MYEGEARDVIDRAKKRDRKWFEPADAQIVPWLFRGGLMSVALGTLLQL